MVSARPTVGRNIFSSRRHALRSDWVSGRGFVPPKKNYVDPHPEAGEEPLPLAAVSEKKVGCDDWNVTLPCLSGGYRSGTFFTRARFDPFRPGAFAQGVCRVKQLDAAKV